MDLKLNDFENTVEQKIDKSKNKQESNIQITAEQIIRSSHEYIADDLVVTNTYFDTKEELDDYTARKRKRFEQQTQKNRYNVSSWFKYADWEVNLKEYKRARNIYERAIEVDYKNISIWLRYAEMEMKSKNINRARNIWERAIKLLPRHDQLWYKYAYMEEILGNYIGAREIFKAWMTWKPSEDAWMAFVSFEERMGEIDKAREVFFKFIKEVNTVSSFIKFAKFEETHRNLASARSIYEAALNDLGEKALDEDFFISFIKFELKHKELERAKALFSYGLEKISALKSATTEQSNVNKEDLYAQYSGKLFSYFLIFQKEYGDEDFTEHTILIKRRKIYEKEIEENPLSYDTWIAYIKLEEEILSKQINTVREDQISRIRDIYEKAISNFPCKEEKSYWKRYIFIWIKYALFEELETLNINRAEEIYKKVLEIIPHSKFTFSKIWIMYGHFLIRRLQLDSCRELFEKSIELNPREKIFKAYLELELQLGNLHKCRKIFEKFIYCFSNSANAWIKFAEFEESLEETDRSRAIYELAIEQENVDYPELIWKSYINLEKETKNYDNVRFLYQRILKQSNNIKIWETWVKFEEEIENFSQARKVLQQADKYYKEHKDNENRAQIRKIWYEFENLMQYKEEDYNIEYLQKIEKLQPIRIKKKREISTDKDNHKDNDEELDFEEFFDYIFPDDEIEKPKNLKLLELAKQWEKEQNN